MKKSSLHSCNVLETGADRRHLWEFISSDDQLKLNGQQTISAQQPLPLKNVTKDWRSLWQRRLNIAWLPADQVFLRVLHLPAPDPTEVLAMVEFQLEKLSPLPVNQIVWSIEPLPQHAENMQTLVVIIAARSLIEQFLGQLETAGYLPDRLELPSLHQLLVTPGETNGVWIYPSVESGRTQCLVAWWYGGVLQQLQLLHLPATGHQGAVLVEQLTKTAWAGEMEGWLTSPPRCHLVAESATASAWESPLQQWAGAPVTILQPLGKAELAELSANRAAREETKASMLPPEYTVRYQQQWVDRLWMSGLAAVVATYLVGVVIYFGSLQVLKFQHHTLLKHMAGLSDRYTNAMKLKARGEVLQNQLNLKYSALDSLRVASELLPPELTLNLFRFSRGQKLELVGTAPQDQSAQVTEYNAALRKATVNGEILFTKIEPPRVETRGQQVGWRFTCDLNRPEFE